MWCTFNSLNAMSFHSKHRFQIVSNTMFSWYKAITWYIQSLIFFFFERKEQQPPRPFGQPWFPNGCVWIEYSINKIFLCEVPVRTVDLQRTTLVNLMSSPRFPVHPFPFCCRMTGRLGTLQQRGSSQWLSGFFTSKVFTWMQSPGLLCYRQAFLGAALKYSSVGMSATPPYHFWSQMCSTHIFMKNHSYWRGHFLIPGCLQKQREKNVAKQRISASPRDLPPLGLNWTQQPPKCRHWWVGEQGLGEP